MSSLNTRLTGYSEEKIEKLTFEKTLDTLKYGRKYYDPLYGNYVFRKDSINVVVDYQYNNNKIVTVTTSSHPKEDWVIIE